MTGKQRLPSSPAGPDSCRLSPHHLSSETVAWLLHQQPETLVSSSTTPCVYGQAGRRRPVQGCPCITTSEQHWQNQAPAQLQGGRTVGICLCHGETRQWKLSSCWYHQDTVSETTARAELDRQDCDPHSQA